MPIYQPLVGGRIVWQTVTGATNAIAGTGYMCNTSGAGFTVTLPAAANVGDNIEFADAASSFDTKNLVIARNGLKIMGLTADMTVDVKDSSFALVYASAALGWRLAT